MVIIPRSFRRIVVSAALFIFSLSATQASVADFTPYKGKYKGSWTLTLNGSAAATMVSARVKTSSNGTAMTLSITGGPIVIENSAVSIATALKFKPQRKLISNAFLMGLGGPLATLPTKYKSKVNKITFSQTAAPGALLGGQLPISGTLNYSIKLKGKTLRISGFGTMVVDGGTYSTSVQLLLKKRK